MNKEEDVETLVKLVNETWVHTHQELAMKAAIAKHVEFCEIWLYFPNVFKLDDISD